MNWTRNANVVWEELGGCALLVDAKVGTCWRLNAAASAAWKLFDGAHSLSQIADMLLVSNDSVSQFCGELQAFGLMGASQSVVTAFSGFSTGNPFRIEPISAGAGQRRRPSPRGNSGPG